MKLILRGHNVKPMFASEIVALASSDAAWCFGYTEYGLYGVARFYIHGFSKILPLFTEFTALSGTRQPSSAILLSIRQPLIELALADHWIVPQTMTLLDIAKEIRHTPKRLTTPDVSPQNVLNQSID